MPRLRYLGFQHTDVYQGPTGIWSPGDVREVEEPEASRLQADFPGVFVIDEPAKPDPIKAPPRSAAMGTPPVARDAKPAIKPKRARATRKRSTSKKTASKSSE